VYVCARPTYTYAVGNKREGNERVAEKEEGACEKNSCPPFFPSARESHSSARNGKKDKIGTAVDVGGGRPARLVEAGAGSRASEQNVALFF
jgi:hypothetical protein